MNKRTYTITGIVLKRSNIGESDRIVTILSKEEGRQAYVAKGIRRTNSSSGSYFEPGNRITAHCVRTKSLSILTQSKLVTSGHENKSRSLADIRRISQLLEIFDGVFVAEELETPVFNQIELLHRQAVMGTTPIDELRLNLRYLIQLMGFDVSQDPKKSLAEELSAILEKPLRSFDFLVVK
ncbi:MAG: DNA repair protein RecO [Candidatus Pacebacteria bacterium]|nr:DNA repair protein RecO [Candidatus Paceibacterota bacterium]